MARLKKEDFHKGQTVYILKTTNRRKDSTLEENIHEAKVLTVGRRYITTNWWGRMRFDSEKGFQEDTIYTPSFKLYLSKEQIFKEAERYSIENEVEKLFRWEYGTIRKMTTEDLKAILDIVNKYRKV